MHARPVGVEDADDFGGEIVLAHVVENERLRATLTLIVAGAQADRIDVAPIVFALRMHCRIAIDLGRRGLQELDLQALGEPQHIDRADHARLGGLDGIELIMNWRGWAGQVINLINFYIERKSYVVTLKVKGLVVE